VAGVDGPRVADGAAPGRDTGPAPAPPGDALPACLRTVNVSSSDAFAAAVAATMPGDCIVLADGNYSGVQVTRSGTATNPITIKADHLGMASISSGIIDLQGAAWIIVHGLSFTGPGGSAATDGTRRNCAVAIVNGNNDRVTRCTFRLKSPPANTFWVMLGGNSSDNRVDHSDFGGAVSGRQTYVFPTGTASIAGNPVPADRTPWATGNSPRNPNIARRTLIDHNHFHDKAGGTAETIVLGGLGVTGDYQDTLTTVEYNLFVNCDGDAEIISIKSSSNIFRYNTVRTSNGFLSSRAGNNNAFYGNFVLKGGKSGGIKLNERNHKVYNNYIENTADYPIMLEGGNPYDQPGFVHAQVVNAIIVNNTIVNAGRPVSFKHGGTLAPQGCVFANNIITGTGPLFSDGSQGTIFAGNLTFPASVSIAGFMTADPRLVASGGIQHLGPGSPAIDAATGNYPFLTDDVFGNPRHKADIGAEELSLPAGPRHPLTPADVGPSGP
jgi:poly(beta-D-mannuronate) lyase